MAYEKPPQDPVVYTHQDFGAAFFDANLPNSYERMWMVARAINFDMTNYNKFYSGPDTATKKRYLKNVFRFLDSPINYIFWHTRVYWERGTFRFLPFYFLLTYGITFWHSGALNYQDAVDRSKEAVYSGHAEWDYPTETFTFDKNLTLLFHDHEFMMDKGMVSQKAAPPNVKFIRLNDYVRNQNFRKYFAHRERRGADLFTGKPSK